MEEKYNFFWKLEKLNYRVFICLALATQGRDFNHECLVIIPTLKIRYSFNSFNNIS